MSGGARLPNLSTASHAHSPLHVLLLLHAAAGAAPELHDIRKHVHLAQNSCGALGRISHLRVPFCLAYARTPPTFRTGKLAPQAEACLHLGYSRSKPGYVLEVLEGPRAGKVITSSQVKFREDVFPRRDTIEPSTDVSILWDNIAPCEDDDIAHNFDHDDGGDDSEDDSSDEMPDLVDGSDAEGDSNSDDDENDTPGAPVQRPTRSNTTISDWRATFTAFDRMRKDGSINVLSTGAAEQHPKHFKDIAKIKNVQRRNEWFKAYFAENDGLFDSGVLNPVPRPASISDKDLMYLLSLFTKKADGRLKVHSVLSAGKDKIDMLGYDYGRTFAPTARPTTLRMLCALSALHDLIIRGGDVRQAYTLGDWPAQLRKVLAHMPQGYRRFYDGVDHCVEVGNLYGHPVAGRNWWKRFRRWALEDGYIQSEHDPCYFRKFRDGEEIHLIVYVDDVLTFSTKDSVLYDEFEASFDATFNWTNFGTDLHEFTSIRITQMEGKVTLDMERYIEDMIAELFPGGVHHAYTVPADTDLSNVVYAASVAKDTTYAKTPLAKRFRSLLMKLLYAACQARPDIAVSVGLLSRVQAWPNPDLMLRAERIAIYAYGTKDLKLTYVKTDKTTPTSYWAPRAVVAGHADSTFELAHSTTGYVWSLANAAIAWISKKQETIAISSAQAEISAGSEAACEGVHQRGLMAEAGHVQNEPTVLYLDSSNAIDLANDPMHHAKAKHIDRRDLFIRELVENGVIMPKYVKTADNPADALTKPLPKALFVKHRAKIMGLEVI